MCGLASQHCSEGEGESGLIEGTAFTASSADTARGFEPCEILNPVQVWGNRPGEQSVRCDAYEMPMEFW